MLAPAVIPTAPPAATDSISPVAPAHEHLTPAQFYRRYRVSPEYAAHRLAQARRDAPRPGDLLLDEPIEPEEPISPASVGSAPPATVPVDHGLYTSPTLDELAECADAVVGSEPLWLQEHREPNQFESPWDALAVGEYETRGGEHGERARNHW